MIKVKEMGFLPVLQRQQVESAEGAPYENVLKTITPASPIYRTKADMLYNELLGSIKDTRLRERLVEGELLAKPMVADTYYTHYSPAPLLKEPGEIQNEVLREIRNALADYMASSEYRKIRKITKMNHTLSTVFALRFAAELARLLPEEVLKDYQPTPTTPKPGKGGGSGGQQVGAQGQKPQGKSGGSTGQKRGCGKGGCKHGKSKGKRSGRSQQSRGGERAQAPKKLPPNIREAIRQAVKQALEEAGKATEEAEVLQGFDRSPGTLAFIDAAPDIDTVELAEFVRIIGELRKKLPLMFARKKREERLGDIEGYAKTSKPERAIAEELALPEELFLAKMAEEEFISRRRVVTPPGLLVLLLDKSGSMGSTKMAWAKALAYAFSYKAAREGADLVVIPYDRQPYEPLPLESLQDLLALLKIQSNGGTHIASAILAGVDEIERRKAIGNSTIILITDGEDNSPETMFEELKDKLREAKAKLHVAFIEGDNESLRRLARLTGGDLYTVEPTADSALRLVKL